MSRIYEALQKAESERKLDRREPEPRIPEQPISAGVGAAAAVAEPEETVFPAPNFVERPFVNEPYAQPPATAWAESRWI